jgi:hypothetical protein
MAFDRLISLKVGDPRDDGQPITGLELEELDVEFDVMRSVTFAENTAKFKIYNVSKNTSNEILKEGNVIVFRAGYKDDGGLGIVFIGNITRAIRYRSGPNYITEVEAATTRGESKPLRTLPVSLSYAPKTKVSSILKALADVLLVPITGAENANKVYPEGLPNGWTYVGPIRGALKYCSDLLAKEKVTIFQDNGELVIYDPNDENISFEVGPELTYENGLIQVSPISETLKDEGKKGKKKKKKEKNPPKRVSFLSLMNYRIRPNGLARISDTGTQDGAYIIETARFFGDNFGGDFNVQCEARAGGKLQE